MLKFKNLFILFVSLVLVSSFSCSAACKSAVTFGWNYDFVCSDLSGFNLYQSEDPNLVDPNFSGIPDPGIIVGVINDPNARAYNLIDVGDGIHFWYLTAFDTHLNESLPSNVVSTELDTTAPNPVGFYIHEVRKTETEYLERTTVTTTISTP